MIGVGSFFSAVRNDNCSEFGDKHGVEGLLDLLFDAQLTLFAATPTDALGVAVCLLQTRRTRSGSDSTSLSIRRHRMCVL